jgi:hypothetical protein
MVAKVIRADDTEVLDLIDRVVQGKDGGNGSNQYTEGVDNINKRPSGTDRQQALRKLRKDAPKLHAEVLAGKLSPHGAMVQAGFVRRRLPCRHVRAGRCDGRSLECDLPDGLLYFGFR